MQAAEETERAGLAKVSFLTEVVVRVGGGSGGDGDEGKGCVDVGEGSGGL